MRVLRCLHASIMAHSQLATWRCLAQALMSLVAEAFPRRPPAEVAACVGELLCTPTFNLYARRHAQLLPPTCPRPLTASLHCGNAGTMCLCSTAAAA